MRCTILIVMFFGTVMSYLSCSPGDSVGVIRVDTESREEAEETEEEEGEIGVMRDITSVQLTAEMGAGINLGNTLDADGPDETFWGNPFTTKAMIDAIAARGFKTLRIPVTWKNHMGSGPDYQIEKTWLDRVGEVVDYGLSNNMYVIINIHHDDSWIIPTFAMEEHVSDQLDKVWTQIANHFKNYGDFLIFETINEPRHIDTPEEWTGGTEEGREVVNRYQQVCLDAIRKTGGNNSLRHIMVSSYTAFTTNQVLDDFRMPDDERTIVSVHGYLPFSMLTGNRKDWGSDSDRDEMDAFLDNVYNRFTSQGIPVVMGEWGTSDYDNTEDRIAHADYYAGGCATRNIVPIWWCVGGQFEGTSGIFNRVTLDWTFGDIADTIINRP